MVHDVFVPVWVQARQRQHVPAIPVFLRLHHGYLDIEHREVTKFGVREQLCGWFGECYLPQIGCGAMVTHVPISQISTVEPGGGHRGYVNVDTGIDVANLHLGILQLCKQANRRLR